jgi:hypothetical protein
MNKKFKEGKAREQYFQRVYEQLYEFPLKMVHMAASL